MQYVLVTVNENHLTGHSDGGVHQIFQYTKPCGGRLGRRDT